MLLSCFSRDSLKGYVYLEAEKQAHAQEGNNNHLIAKYSLDIFFE